MLVAVPGNQAQSRQFAIDRVTAMGNQIMVYWKLAKPGSSTAFELAPDKRTLTQLPQTKGDKGPRRVFHRC